MKQTCRFLALFFIPILFHFYSHADLSNIQPGQSIWCISKEIGSVADILSSKVDMFTAQGDLNTNLTMPLCSQIDIIKDIELYSSSLLSNVMLMIDCVPIPVTGPTTISSSGIYCVANPITGSIVIQADEVTLDLNNYTILGDVQVGSGQSNVVVQNGVVDNAMQGTAVDVNSGTSNITINDVTTQNAHIGINFESVTGGMIKNCSMVQNVTGLQLDTSHKIIVTDCVAECNVNIGYSLISSTTNYFSDCQALSTGEGNTQTVDQTIAGFISTDGTGNIFERCIANATHALSTTDSRSLVGGFVLQGSESCSKIINSESANTIINSAGNSNAYGIGLQPSVSDLAQIASVSQTRSTVMDWSPDGQYIAAALLQTGGLTIYRFNPATHSLTSVQSDPTSKQFHNLAWSKANNIIAGVGNNDGVTEELTTYVYNPLFNTLTSINTFDYGAGDESEAYAVRWSVDGRYLAVGGRTEVDLRTYEVNFNNNTISQLGSSFTPVTGNLATVDWHPSGQFIVGGLSGTARVILYSFNPASNPTTSVLQTISVTDAGALDRVGSIKWSPDGRYVVAKKPSGSQSLIVYEFNGVNTLTEVSRAGTPTTDTSLGESVSWSADGLFVFVTGNSINGNANRGVEGYRFSDGFLFLEKAIDTGGTISGLPNFASSLSPDNNYLATGGISFSGSSNALKVYTAVDFPSKNAITNNTVYCTSGGGNAVGISASEYRNLIIQNTVYNNTTNLGLGSFADQLVNSIDNPTLLQNTAIVGCDTIPQPEDQALLVKQLIDDLKYTQSINDIMVSKACAIMSGIDEQLACMPKVIMSSTVITEPGVYCVANNFTGFITVNSDDVEINMNHQTITGNVSVNDVSNVFIHHGAIDNNYAQGTALQVNSGAEYITINNVDVKHAQVGINCDGVTNAIISNCEMTLNVTGLQLESSHKVSIDHCTAQCNSRAGFDLISSTTNILQDCRALSTGEGNNAVADNLVFGFISADGYSNIFERCIANSTLALSTTNYQSYVAGIALRGSEGCTKIIECEAANSGVNTSGHATPYGILLEATLGSDLAIVNNNPLPNPEQSFTSFSSVQWDPSGRFLAVGTGSGLALTLEKFFIYEYNPVLNRLEQIFSAGSIFSIQNIINVSWSPSGRYIAITTQNFSGGNEPALILYKFDAVRKTATELQRFTFAQLGTLEALSISQSLAWHPSEQFLMLGALNTQPTGPLPEDEIPVDILQLFEFNRVTEQLTRIQISTTDEGPDYTALSISWNPNGKWIAVASGLWRFTDPNDVPNLIILSFNYMRLYRFDEVTKQFSLSQIMPQFGNFIGNDGQPDGEVVTKVSWSPDGKFLLAAQLQAPPAESTQVYLFELNEEAGTLEQRATVPGTANEIQWSPEGRYVAIYFFNEGVTRIYELDRGSKQLVFLLETSNGGTPLSWRPDGALLAATVSGTLGIIEGLQFPMKNIITNNVVYCNAGNECPGSFGIGGSSILNMITNNTAYANPLVGQASEQSPFILENYVYVTNVFDHRFYYEPTLLQNISVPSCDQIPAPADVIMLAENICNEISIIDSTLDIIESIIDNIVTPTMGLPCWPITVFGPTTITQSGIYCLNNAVSGEIKIEASDVQLDLNTYTVTGDLLISVTQTNITIQNGVVDNNGALGNAISAQAGAENIILENITVKNAQVGINFDQVTGGRITNCSMTQNVTGLELDQSSKILVDSCVASCNTNAGFCLLSSSTNIIQNSKALSTGQGNTNTTDQTIFGFVSADGYGNIFERCIANATQALSTTDSQSLVAGFALRGSEGCTKIIECESANAQTSASGFTVPVGILLEGALSNPITLTTSLSVSLPRSVDWSPDGQYILVASDGSDEIFIYEFDRTKKNLTQSASSNDAVLLASPRSVDWSPDGQYIAVADAALPDILIYKFDKSISSLTRIAQANDVVLVSPRSASWSPNEQYIAVADAALSDILVYEFNKISQTISRIIRANDGFFSSAQSSSWSPDGNYIAVADATIPSLAVYKFTPSGPTLIRSDDESTGLTNPVAAQWSPDGKYIAVADENSVIAIFEFNPETETLIFLTSTTTSLDVPRSVDWSEDGKYVVVADDDVPATLVFEYDRRMNELLFKAESDNNGLLSSPTDAQWSPDGNYIASVDTGANLVLIYEALIFSSKNVIANNTIYCNSGGAIPSGIGISGSSIQNMIIGNTAYANPINPFMVPTNYAFCTNVFNPLFGYEPTALQNLSIGGCEAIPMAQDIVLLAQQIKSKLCEAPTVLDEIESKIDAILVAQAVIESCPEQSILATDLPYTISQSGVYCLASTDTMEGDIVIQMQAPDTILHLNNRTLFGSISVAAENVGIDNGTVDANGAATGIAITADGIVLEGVAIKNAIVGATLEHVSGGTIKNCSFVQNVTGIQLDGAHKIVIDSCVAECNTNAGFDLINSTTNIIQNSKALATGQGNNNLTEQTIFGFVSSGGYANIFERCIANATQALSTTDQQSLVAGFALRGSEDCSKIVGCESANAQTSPDGVTVPVGILLDPNFNGLNNPAVTLTDLRDALSLAWSPDGVYLAVGANFDPLTINFAIYKFDRVAHTLQLVASSELQGGAFTLDWSPDGRYLAVGNNSTTVNDIDLNLYRFDCVTEHLTEVDAISLGTSPFDGVFGLDWSPNGRYLAVAGLEFAGAGDKDLILYRFDPFIEKLIEVDDKNFGVINAGARSVAWSPDGNYLAVGGNFNTSSDTDFQLYQFDSATETLQLRQQINIGSDYDRIIAVAWSPDGRYLALAGNQGYILNDKDLFMYQFNPTDAVPLTLVADFDLASDYYFDAATSLDWSPDGRYLAMGGLPNQYFPGSFNDLFIFEFDRGINALTVVASKNFDVYYREEVAAVKWSPDGAYLAIGIEAYTYLDTNVIIYKVFDSSKNVIKDNTVYCNSGGNVPYGMGIVASSIQNLVIGNTSYANPIMPFMVDQNYANVTNVFNPLFQNEPTALQNISVAGCDAVMQREDIPLLVNQITAKLIGVGEDLLSFIDEIQIASSLIENITACTPTQVLAPTTITQEGIYCVGVDIPGSIVIQQDNVELYLNNQTINGFVSVSSGRENIRIVGGIINNNNQGGIGLQVNTGARSITVDDVAIRNAQVGINFDAVTGGVIKNCSMVQNVTAVQLDHSHKIIIDNCISRESTQAGFSLVSSTTNLIQNSQALSTGSRNTQMQDQTIIGFVSTDGYANIFEQCIANDTQGLFVTDADSLVAGIALRGSEEATKIIDCEVGNSKTNGGSTIAYGIALRDDGGNSPIKNIVMRNVVYCTSGGGGGIGISGNNVDNLIIQNVAYNNQINLQIGSLVDEIISSIDNPTDLTNIAVPGCGIIEQEADPGLLAKQILSQLTNITPSLLELISTKLDQFVVPDVLVTSTLCDAQSITQLPFTITDTGIYCLSASNTLQGDITIDATAPDSELRLNNRTMNGSIVVNAAGVRIVGGTIDADGAATGIAINADNVELDQVVVKNAIVGAYMQNVIGGLIEHCSFVQNVTGMQLDGSHKIIIDNCVAECNINCGFELLSSTTNTIQNSKSLSTGQGNNEFVDQTIFGFVSADGYANIFERCIANATQALSTTDSQSLVAGFALRGSEGCSKIIECESANAQTNTSGYTMPQGIFLDYGVPTVDVVATQDTTFAGDAPLDVVWSPDGRFILGGVEDVWEFNRLTNSFTQIADLGAKRVCSVAWSACGNYVAIGQCEGTILFKVYSFDQSTLTFTLIYSEQVSSFIEGISFHPTSRYIAVAPNGNVRLYTLNTLTQQVALATVNSPVTANYVRWSPDGNYLCVEGVGYTMFKLDTINDAITLVSNTLSSSRNIAWSPEGKYFAGTNSSDLIRVNLFNRDTQQISQFAVPDVSSGTTRAFIFSNDGQYLFVGQSAGASSRVLVYRFDKDNAQLTFVAQSATFADSIFGIDISADGKYLALALRSEEIKILDIQGNAPSKNVIANNVVYCNSGGAIPLGIGINGSSISNMIIGNTSYANPINPFAIEQNYANVVNVFNPLFAYEPTALQNISVEGCDAIAMPESITLLQQQLKGLACSAVDVMSVIIQEAKTAMAAIGMNPWLPQPVTTAPTTLSGNAFYCIGSDLSGLITIDGSNVKLDLNTYHLSGGIEVTAGQEDVRILNGRVSRAGASGILVNAGAANIELHNVTAQSSDVGVNFNGVTSGLIKNCVFAENATGLQLNASHKICVDSCTANCNTQIGYSLISSTTNVVQDCKALSTGEGNTNQAGQTIVGFDASNGYGNIFERCIANGTQGLTVTGADSLVSGFALRGDEECTKIIDCESGTVQTNASGVAVPYGMYIGDSAMKNVILRNTIYCTSGAGSGIGLRGNDVNNLIIQNTLYNNPINLQVGSNVDEIISTIDNPTLLTNIALPGCEPIPTQENIALLLKQISTKVDTLALTCTPIAITSADIMGGTITLAQEGSYCCATDLTADMNITGSCITVDFNERTLTGQVTVSGQYVTLFGGRVLGTAATSNNDPAAIALSATAHQTHIFNMIVRTANTATTGINGRAALSIESDFALIENSTIYTGAGGAHTSGTGGDGGIGVIVSSGALSALLQELIINTGVGGAATSGTGGDGGAGIHIEAGANKTKICRCTILNTGAGGTAATNGSNGSGIVNQSGAINTMVTECIIRSIGTSAIDGTEGLAIEDSSDNSTVFKNIAHSVANQSFVNDQNGVTTFFKLHNMFSGQEVGAPPSNDIVDRIANLYLANLAQ